MRFSLPAAALLSLALATGSHAQLPSSVTAGLSVQCLGGLAGLITNSALNQCLQLTEAVGAFGAAGQTSSLIPAFNTYLSNSICPGAPCNSTTIMTANSTIGTACSSELQNGTSIATVLSFLFSNYDSVRSAFCLEDTTQNNQLCVTQTLTNIQTSTMMNVSLNTLLSLNSTTLGSLVQALAQNQSALCTDCNKGILTTLAPTLNASTGAAQIGSSFVQACGNNSIGTIPTSLRQVANGTSSGGANTATGGSTPGSGSSGSGSSSGNNGASDSSKLISLALVIFSGLFAAGLVFVA